MLRALGTREGQGQHDHLVDRTTGAVLVASCQQRCHLAGDQAKVIEV